MPLEFIFGEEALVRVLDGKVGRTLTVWLLAPVTILQQPRSSLIVEQLTRMLGAFE